MSLPRKAVLGILKDNLVQRHSVLPLSKQTHTAWAAGLNLPRGGETVIYTGQMYQLIPTIATMARRMASLEDSVLTQFMGLGRLANKAMNLAPFMGKADKNQQEIYDRTLNNIARLLQAAKVQFGYLYEDDLYSGALIHDQGLDQALLTHAKYVQKTFDKHHVKNLITVDPHTTHMLRTVYPEILDGFKMNVRSYLEVLVESDLKPNQENSQPIAIHDSCVYARFENVLQQPRDLLDKTGAQLQEPELSGKLTHCCGGPIESLFPARAHEIAQARLKQFEKMPDCQIATMCPICLVNLQGAAGDKKDNCKDIAHFLAQAFLAPSTNNNPPTT